MKQQKWRDHNSRGVRFNLANSLQFYKGNKEQEKDIEAIRKEIAQCLQIENLNFLLGSGCSSFVLDGTEKAIRVMQSLAGDFFKQNSDFKVSNTFLKDKFPDNLEALLDFLIAARLIHGIEPLFDGIEKKIKHVQGYIRDQIIAGSSSEEVLKLYKAFYLKTVRKTRKTPVNIFTTNYDLYNEKALDELGFFYNNGFTGTYNRRFNPISYNYTFVENMNLNKDIWERVSNFFNLYKIHGSINWVSINENILEKDIDNIGQDDVIMIYPTPQKDRTTLMTPYSDLFRNMQYSIMKPNSVLITMGYSFSDDHINRIILNALAVPSFRVVVFGNSDNINKLKALNDSRIWIIHSEDKLHYFKSVVENLMPEMQDELLEKLSMLDGATAIRKFEMREDQDE